MVKYYPRIIPAAIANMVANDSVRRLKFIYRQCKTADQHYRYPHPIGHPAKPAGQTYEKISMVQKIDPLLQGSAPGKIFRAVRNDVKSAAHTIIIFSINAQYSVAKCFKVFYHVQPATSVVPVFGLTAGLRRDADVWIFNPAYFIPR